MPTVPLDLAAWWDRNTASVPQVGALLRRSARAKQLKRILPLVAIMLVCLTLLWPIVSDRLAVSTITEALTPELAMLNLDYTGTDKNGRPFNVVADKAVRQKQAAPAVATGTTQPTAQIGIVTLDAPRAVLQQESGTTVNLSSTSGVYDEKAQGLTLNGAVQLGREDIKVLAPNMAVDLKAGRAWTDQPVVATGNFGRIDGEGLRLEDNGKRIIFTGKSRAVLNGAAANTPEPDTGTAPTLN